MSKKKAKAEKGYKNERPVSLAPLTPEQAIRAVFASGPDDDAKAKPAKKQRRKKK